MNMSTKKIGIVGGMGPKTGVDLANKIIKNTHADIDQDHLPFLLVSYPHEIKDRTEFLQGIHDENPANIVYQLICQLKSWGADVIGVPCNTLHSDPIMKVILKQLNDNEIEVVLVNMIEAVAEFILNYFPNLKKIGLLATLGTYQNTVYSDIFHDKGLKIIHPDDEIKKNIHQAIYNPNYGIKSGILLEDNQAQSILKNACQHLINLGAEVIILGCSEIPLVLNENSYKGIPLVDPANILARKLIELVDNKKLTTYVT